MKLLRILVAAALAVLPFFASAQQREKYRDPDMKIRLWDGAAPGSEAEASIPERLDTAPDGTIIRYTYVNTPEIWVWKPSAEKAGRRAVIILPGGGLMGLTWAMEGLETAKWLNDNGYTAIVLKYRVGRGEPSKGGPGRSPDAESLEGITKKLVTMQAKVYDAGEIVHANTNPSPQGSGAALTNPAADAARAMEIVRSHAEDWNIDPGDVGVMGFSAGGGVELAANALYPEFRPAYIVSLYGPSLMEIMPDGNEPPLFVAVTADHKNVAAGCTALFYEWKKAGSRAEIHIYDSQKTFMHWHDSFLDWVPASK